MPLRCDPRWRRALLGAAFAHRCATLRATQRRDEVRGESDEDEIPEQGDPDDVTFQRDQIVVPVREVRAREHERGGDENEAAREQPALDERYDEDDPNEELG